MANFCPNCGLKMKGKFCSGCGTAPAETTSGLIGRWEAKYIDNTEGSSNYKGTISLTKTELTFHSYGFFTGDPKEKYRIPLSQIKSITRMPLFNITTIKYNKAPQGSGGLRKFFSGRNVMLKISDWKSFIENIRSLNTNIIIKA